MLIDVRNENEFEDGFIPCAVNVPRGLIEFRICKLVGFPDKTNMNTKIMLYCATAGSCALAIKSLQDLGFTNVTSVEMKFEDWAKAGNPVAMPKKWSGSSGYQRGAAYQGAGPNGSSTLSRGTSVARVARRVARVGVSLPGLDSAPARTPSRRSFCSSGTRLRHSPAARRMAAGVGGGFAAASGRASRCGSPRSAA